MHSRPSVASAINLFIKNYLPTLDKFRFGSNYTNKIFFTGDEGLYHPDVLKFHELVLNRYKIDPRKRLIVLLPCSAKKPYRESKSHKIFEKVIRKAAKKNYYKVEIWSLTSPIGIVPRELETTYPAGYYDIPVTGDWSEEESQITGNLLAKMLSQIPKEVGVIIHISTGYKRMVEIGTRGMDSIISWVDKSPTSFVAQKKLGETVQLYFENANSTTVDEKYKYVHKWQNEVDSILRYNHGPDISLDISDTKFFGRPPRPIQVKKGDDHLFSWDTLRGRISLSPSAALEIAQHSNNWIITDIDELKGSTLFSIGIIDASENISPNDEVLIFNSDKSLLLGVGIATISGYSMNRVDSGIAAKIKKKCRLEVEEV
jgi:archaeosine synthase